MERQPISILIAAPTENTFLKDGQLSAENPYIKKLARAAIIPIIATPDMKPEQIDDLYGRASGLLIPGGTDIEPWRYGQAPHGQLMKELNPQLDELQLTLVGKAAIDAKPLLGVCRGAQIMAVAHGGTLHQHLPDLIPHEEHGVSVNALGVPQVREDIFHDVHILKNAENGVTKAYTIFQREKLENAPSKHHQAVDNPGRLVVTGRSYGRIAEVIEDPTLPYHMGVQFHPELSDSESLNKIFESFANAAERFKTNQEIQLPFIPSQIPEPIAL
jgi:putative glutamine amidotransferase